MTPADIARRLDQRLRLFASTDRSAPGRHRTLDAAVRWSYELCDDTQRRVFDRLSVFVGPFTIDAPEVVVSGEGVEEWEVLDGVLALVDKSLVVADETAADTRYRLFETMRQFGQANLAAADTHQLYRDRHAAYYCDYVLSRRSNLHGKNDVAAVDAVEGELDNIRVALRQAVDDHSSARFDQLLSSLFTVWTRGRSVEGAAWAAELQGRPVIDPAARIMALGFAAMSTVTQNPTVAEELVAAAEEVWQANTTAPPPVIAISMRSAIAMMNGRDEQALSGCDWVIAMADAEPDLFVRASALSTCMSVAVLCGGFDRVGVLQRATTTLVDQLDNRYLLAAISLPLAAAVLMTEPDRAGELLRQAYALNEEVGNRTLNVTTAGFIAITELRSGNAVAAAQWAARGLQLAVDHGPAFTAQAVSATIAIIKRYSLADATVLLGALHAYRARQHTPGTQQEVNNEIRQERSLQRALSDRFDERHGYGLTLSADDMINLAQSQLEAIIRDAATSAPSAT